MWSAAFLSRGSINAPARLVLHGRIYMSGVDCANVCMGFSQSFTQARPRGRFRIRIASQRCIENGRNYMSDHNLKSQSVRGFYGFALILHAIIPITLSTFLTNILQEIQFFTIGSFFTLYIFDFLFSLYLFYPIFIYVFFDTSINFFHELFKVERDNS